MAAGNDVLIAALKRKRRIAINKRKELQKRKTKVESVYEKSFKMDDYATLIDNKIKAVEDNLSAGIVGITDVSLKNEAIDSFKENNPLSSQISFSGAISHMAAEIQRLNDDINECSKQESSYENQIRALGGVILPWD